MPMEIRRTVSLTKANDRFLKSVRNQFRSVSEIVQIALDKFQQDHLKQYYQQKSEDYRSLHQAQAKLIQKLEAE